jgi:hypothetical protein
MLVNKGKEGELTMIEDDKTVGLEEPEIPL